MVLFAYQINPKLNLLGLEDFPPTSSHPFSHYFLKRKLVFSIALDFWFKHSYLQSICLLFKYSSKFTFFSSGRMLLNPMIMTRILVISNLGLICDYLDISISVFNENVKKLKMGIVSFVLPHEFSLLFINSALKSC